MTEPAPDPPGLPPLERLEIGSAEALWAWLEANHARADGALLVTPTKAAGGPVATSEILDALIAHGWIDGRRWRLDGRRTMQLISPRRHDRWAKTYRDRAARLEAEGRMRPPGRAAIERAKRSGGWEALAEVDALAVPEDLAAALAASPGAAERFEAMAPSYRRNVLRWIALAKRPETRAARIARAAEATAAGRRLPQM